VSLDEHGLRQLMHDAFDTAHAPVDGLARAIAAIPNRRPHRHRAALIAAAAALAIVLGVPGTVALLRSWWKQG
jgi:hypothetical protein